MICNCDGVTCPCGIPCSCPASPCGCTDCKNSATHVCQLCWQPFSPSSKENACQCFTVDSETGVSLQRSAADSSAARLEQSCLAHVKEESRLSKDSGVEVRTVSGTNINTDPGAQLWGVTGTGVRIDPGAQVGGVTGTGVSTDPGAQVRGETGTGVRTDPGAQVRGETGTGVSTDPCAQVRGVAGAGVRIDPGAQVRGETGTGVSTDPGAQVRGVTGAGVRTDPGAQVGAESFVQAYEVPTSHSYRICPICGNFYIVPVMGVIPNVCLQCSGFMTPILPYVSHSPYNLITMNCESNLIPSVSLPYANLEQHLGGHGAELRQQFLQQLNETRPEDAEDFIRVWLQKTKISPYRKD